MSGLFENIFDDTSIGSVVVTCLDILIVYYVIYRVLLTIKGTRAAQMVIGIVLIGASFFVAERLDMTTVSWLLDNFINYFIIIVIVVFQQDIRRGLMRLGQNVVPFGKTHQLAHALDEVLAAAEYLAKARMGGIVVFEREAELKHFVAHGTLIDSRVSKELLVSLFVPSRDNELHDGAVVIDKNLRISRAGVVLPLSRSTELASTLGTRHRAALGITEETDAVAVVISEERGEISLCVKGNIARDLEPDTLRRALQDLFDEEHTVDVAKEAQAAVDISRAVAALAGEPERPGAEPRRGPAPGGTTAPGGTVRSVPRSSTSPTPLPAAGQGGAGQAAPGQAKPPSKGPAGKAGSKPGGKTGSESPGSKTGSSPGSKTDSSASPGKKAGGSAGPGKKAGSSTGPASPGKKTGSSASPQSPGTKTSGSASPQSPGIKTSGSASPQSPGTPGTKTSGSASPQSPGTKAGGGASPENKTGNDSPPVGSARPVEEPSP